MGKVYDGIDDRIREWVARQALFFTGTAPLAEDGHVNVSPKGPIGSLRIVDDHTSPTSTWWAAAPRRSRTCARTGGSW